MEPGFSIQYDYHSEVAAVFFSGSKATLELNVVERIVQ